MRLVNGTDLIGIQVLEVLGSYYGRCAHLLVRRGGEEPVERYIDSKPAELFPGVSIRTLQEKVNRGLRVGLYCEFPEGYKPEVI